MYNINSAQVFDQHVCGIFQNFFNIYFKPIVISWYHHQNLFLFKKRSKFAFKNKVYDDGREKSERISQEFSPVFWPHQCELSCTWRQHTHSLYKLIKCCRVSECCCGSQFKTSKYLRQRAFFFGKDDKLGNEGLQKWTKTKGIFLVSASFWHGP